MELFRVADKASADAEKVTVELIAPNRSILGSSKEFLDHSAFSHVSNWLLKEMGCAVLPDALFVVVFAMCPPELVLLIPHAMIFVPLSAQILKRRISINGTHTNGSAGFSCGG